MNTFELSAWIRFSSRDDTIWVQRTAGEALADPDMADLRTPPNTAMLELAIVQIEHARARA